jgi:Zn-dependent peptidase ImmA (M78 family)/DNA-binding XRE family transcriptional regulator
MVRLVAEGDIGARIADARESAGLSQGELAAEVSIDRSAMNKIERGTRRVTAFELSEIARVLKRRMEWFLTEPTPAIVSHREREGTSRRGIDAVLEDLTREVAFVASYSQRIALREYVARPVPTTKAEAEALAAEVRTELVAGDNPITDLVAAAEALGLLTFSQPLGPDAADGGSVLLEAGGVALVNSTSDVGRRRMTLAHEIGHYVVADEYTIDHAILQSGDGDRESLLDRFARALLCPSGPTQTYWNRQLDVGDLRSAALKSASHWRVDFATLARRLLDLGIVGMTDAQEIRSVRAVKADFVELNLHVPDDLDGTSLPPSFELAVLALFRAETISAARALQLLRGTYDDQDLPDRPTNPESAAWQVAW